MCLVVGGAVAVATPAQRSSGRQDTIAELDIFQTHGER
jgi:hypothetical protein